MVMAARVSLCMIVKDEEHSLPACLTTAADLVDEVVVVDTGSTDHTRAVALNFGAQVFDFPWVDDFAAARNESLRRASGDWIFWIDADDRIDDDNRRRLRALFACLTDDNIGYVMTYLALREMGQDRNSVADHVKLFRNHPDIRWQYRVHEQILPAIERQGGTAHRTEVVIHHLGYQNPDVVWCKLERNLRLLRLQYVDDPGDPVTQFNLGRTTLRLGGVVESVPLLRASIEGLPAGSAFLIRTAYALLIEAHCRLRQGAEALAICREARGRFADDLELLLAEGLVLGDLGDLAGAERCLFQLLERDPDNAAARMHLARLRPVSPCFQFTVNT
jgi:tetratricopeptide (TPR) repeat protein